MLDAGVQLLGEFESNSTPLDYQILGVFLPRDRHSKHALTNTRSHTMWLKGTQNTFHTLTPYTGNRTRLVVASRIHKKFPTNKIQLWFI